MTPADLWLAVPQKIAELYSALLPVAQRAEQTYQTQLLSSVGPVYLKRAGVLEPVVDPADRLQGLFGGPNPLTAALLGSALGAGLGYGGGLTGEKLLGPHVRKGRLRNNSAMLGAVLGTMPGLLMAYPQVKQHGLKGLMVPFAEKIAGVSAGGAFAPVIPVNAFNQVVLSDPYTPLPMRAATAGLVTAASQMRGGTELVSPMDVARIAMGMGSGLVSGLIVGKTLGAVAGLTPEAQERVQQAGVLAGLIMNVVPRAF